MSFAGEKVECYPSKAPKNTISFGYDTTTGPIVAVYENHAILVNPLQVFIAVTTQGVVTFFGHGSSTSAKAVMTLDKKSGLTWDLGSGK